MQQSTNAASLRPTATAGGEDGGGRPHRRRGDPGSHLRDANIELLAVLLEALARENDHLYHSLLTPITSYVMEILPEGHRETTKLELRWGAVPAGGPAAGVGCGLRVAGSEGYGMITCEVRLSGPTRVILMGHVPGRGSV